MKKFEFDFEFQGYRYTAECMSIPIDGSTELHVTPLDSEIFGAFGVRTLILMNDGSISAPVPSPSEERDYIYALAEGLSNYFSSEPKSSN
jgi:hypothetical protein